MRFRLALGYWVILLAVALLGNYLSRFFFEDGLEEFNVHVFRVVVLGGATALFSALYAAETRGPKWLRAALGTGVLWAVLSVAAGASSPRLLMGVEAHTSFETLRLWLDKGPAETLRLWLDTGAAETLRLWLGTGTGRLWMGLPVFQILAPLFMGRMMNMR